MDEGAVDRALERLLTLVETTLAAEEDTFDLMVGFEDRAVQRVRSFAEPLLEIPELDDVGEAKLTTLGQLLEELVCEESVLELMDWLRRSETAEAVAMESLFVYAGDQMAMFRKGARRFLSVERTEREIDLVVEAASAPLSEGRAGAMVELLRHEHARVVWAALHQVQRSAQDGYAMPESVGRELERLLSDERKASVSSEGGEPFAEPLRELAQAALRYLQ